MVFLNADNNLEPFGLTDFREMAKVGSTDDINIIVQFDRNGGFASTNPQWSGCHRFRVLKSMTPTPANALHVLGNTNMGSGVVLRNFVDWAMKEYPAKKYMLDIWNHGQGWRFFQALRPTVTGIDLDRYMTFRVEALSREAARTQDRLKLARAPSGSPFHLPLQSLPMDAIAPGTVRYVSSDDTSNDKLFNREIQDALAGLHLDVIGFDACLMAMVETAYALRDRAKVMVGSEELEPGAGWNYADWLARLSAKPTMSAAELGAVLVQSYGDTYGGLDETVTLSAIDLAKVDQLVNQIDALSRALLKVGATDFGKVVASRKACETYAPGYGLSGIDLSEFNVNLVREFAGNTVGSLASTLLGGLKAATLANYAGQDRIKGFGSQGLSIYFPESKSIFAQDPDGIGYMKTNSQFPVEFVQNNAWSDFLVGRYLA
jgi:hypothetical protein